MSITNLVDCEVRSVIRFLKSKNIRPAETHRQLVEVYGEAVMDEGNVRKLCRLFNGGRTEMKDERDQDARLSSSGIHDNTRPHTAEKNDKVVGEI
jgi:hypothetical protein